MKRKILLLTALMALLIFSLPAYAGAPTNAAQTSVNKVLDVLRNTKLNADVKKEKLRVIYKDMFDEIEFSKRTLGRNWNSLTPAQRTEFVKLFEEILEKSYADKLLDYTNEKVSFYKEDMITPTLAEVRSKIITSSKEIPIFYRMILKDGNWKVYDVVVENVSLVQNYRSQFNDILSKESPEKLLETLRKKVGKH